MVPALAPAVIPAALPSIFEDATGADFSRVQERTMTAAPQHSPPHANPYQSPAAAMFPTGAAQEYGSRAAMPSSVMTACWALGIAGGLSTLLAIFCLVLLLGILGSPPDATGFVFGIVMLVLHLVIAVADIGAVVMLHNRAPGARIVGFVAAALSILGALVHMICAGVAIVGLLHADTGKYLAKR